MSATTPSEVRTPRAPAANTSSHSPAAENSAGTARLYRRVARRETHSPRSTVAIVLAVLVLLFFVYGGTEIVLNMLGLRALVASPTQVADAIGAATTDDSGTVLAVGIAAAVIGLVFVLIGLTGARRARHLLPDDRSVVVVDNEVIASAVARHASLAGEVDPDNTLVTVTHRRAQVRLTPSSGHPVDRAAVVAAAERELATAQYQPAISASVQIASQGKVGA
ncbi:hypothetical protein [Subtercola endophyticus]|uniref:hypothetical protein n=1 Tax=Subtercola endophyticus TaxID=2895559 RepID=UPI001E40BFA0|nr:hypothetical protein [Subtercola endophyticus]UFS58267.1 hypothetical protein LQ955_14770 [Subtercola endophyticus]